MIEETLTVNGEEFLGHRLYGPTYGEQLQISRAGGDTSAEIPYRLAWADTQTFAEAVLGGIDVVGDDFVVRPAMPHPYRDGLVADSVQITPFEPTKTNDEDDYESAVVLVKFKPQPESDDEEETPQGLANGWREQWRGGVQLQERRVVVGTDKTKKHLLPYPLINLSITSPPLPREPITKCRGLLACINSTAFLTPSGISLPTHELLYVTFSADVSVVHADGRAHACWTLTHELLWRPITGWTKDYGERDDNIKDLFRLDGTSLLYDPQDLNTLFTP